MDANTKYTWIYFLKQKSETFAAFTQFHKLIQNQFSTKLKALQIDGGGEFRPFASYLREHGILHRLTCPYTSHQNGSVERKHRQVVEMGLTLLAQATIPYKFWDHNFSTALYLINRLPTVALSDFRSPYEALHHEVPEYHNMRTFGCACFPFLRPYNRHKMELRSAECVYLGPAPQHNGYKCLSSEGRISISKDVLFNETKFPYPILFPNVPTTSQATTPTVNYPSTIPLVTSPSLPRINSNVSLPQTAPLNSSTQPASTQHHTSFSQSVPTDSNTQPVTTSSNHHSATELSPPTTDSLLYLNLLPLFLNPPCNHALNLHLLLP